MNIRITILMILLLVQVPPLRSQPVTEQVHFDNFVSPTDNDLANYFTGGNGMVQVVSGGISGGAIQVPDTVDWGNDVAYYCSHFSNLVQDTITTGISFFYKDSLVFPGSYLRGITLWMYPSTDWNHYILGTLDHNLNIQIITYSVATPTFHLNLQDGHWYQMELNAFNSNSPSGSVDILLSVYDIGVTGIDSPVVEGIRTGLMFDSIFANDPSISTSMVACTRGGVQYLDNFIFRGNRDPLTCPLLNTIPELATPGMNIQYSRVDNSLRLFSQMPLTSVSILDLSGKLVLELPGMNREEMVIDISAVAPGLYMLNCRAADGAVENMKIVLH